MRRVIVCMIAAAVMGSAAYAATTTSIPMNEWTVIDGDSTVTRGHLLLQAESAVRASVNMEVAQVQMTARTTEQRRQGVLTHLTLTYDDGAEETVSLRVPADTQQHQVTFEPKFCDWRRVVELKLMHPADRMELLVTDLIATAHRPALKMKTGGLPGDAVENGLMKVKWMAGAPRAEIYAPRSREIIVFGAKIGNSNWSLEKEENLVAKAVDRNGRVLGRYTEPINGRVQPVLFYLHDLNPAQVDRIIFEAEGNSDFVIRQIIGEGISSRPGTGTQNLAGLEQINDRMEIVIDILEQGGDIPQGMLWQLRQLLLDYRRLE